MVLLASSAPFETCPELVQMISLVQSQALPIVPGGPQPYRLPTPDYPSSQIRLLLVHPRSFDDSSHCSIARTKMHHAPSFHAISYTWGDTLSTCHIYVDGQLFEVRRTDASPGLVQIDSVYIDQDS